jgi:eukaryotic-like serine/threonine-protein kinase
MSEAPKTLPAEPADQKKACQNTHQSEAEPEKPQIDNIEIGESLGKGAMACVYRARHVLLNQIVAVKVFSRDRSGEEEVKRFEKEARLTSMLDHPNIIKTVSFGVAKEGEPYLVLEYLKGVSLADELKQQNGRLSLSRFRDIFLPVLSALDYAHKKGLVHRDIKPANIMICDNDGLEAIKLVDFGVAKRSCTERVDDTAELALTRVGETVGTPTFMSPEQCLAHALDGRADLYSLACVMYQALCGEPPFKAKSPLEMMCKHVSEPLPSATEFCCQNEIPRELAEIVLSGLAKDPAARPQTAFEFAAKIEEVLGSVTPGKPVETGNPKPELRKSPFSSAIAGLLDIVHRSRKVHLKDK